MFKKNHILLVLLVIGGIFTIMAVGCSDSENSTEPRGIVMITSHQNGDVVTGTTTVAGTYTKDITNDIWVLVWPEQAPEQWWPQTNDAASGTPAAKENSNWSVTCSFGGPSQGYDVAVYTATSSTSLFISNKLKEWFNNNNYPGLWTEDLPDGLVEKHRIQVRKIE